MTQLSLFDRPAPAVVPADPNLSASERKRLGPKCLLVLRRLREGPATTGELVPIYHKYSQRIWDLRQAGCVISERRIRPGEHLYTLLREPEGLG